MKKVRIALALAGLSTVLAINGNAVTLTESFTNNPALDGWQVFGDTSLFQWTNDVMDVTWDSSQTNSYFYHPLGTTLTRSDDFCVTFDLQLNVSTAAGFGSELAIGLFNYQEATNAVFQRSTGANSPDLVEFDFFPDAGFGNTVWPLFVDTNSLFNYNSSSDYDIYTPNLGDWYHIEMCYTASNSTMVTTMTNFEQTSGITVVDPVMPTFTDFAVDTVSISSYQDDGFGDSVYAQGSVSNFVLTLPPVVRHVSDQYKDGVGEVNVWTYTGWNYMLLRSSDLISWSNVSVVASGTGKAISLSDTNAPGSRAFYQVLATQP